MASKQNVVPLRSDSAAGQSAKERSRAGEGRTTGSTISRRTPKAIRGGEEVKQERSGFFIPAMIVGLLFTIAVQVLHLAYTSGTVTTRIGHLEDNHKRMEGAISGVQGAAIKLASVEAILTVIRDQLARMETRLDKKEGK